jgi:hypothetical protein
MNILNDKSDITFVSGVETEQVQQEKEEYHLIDTFLRTKGLTLYYYDPKKNEVVQSVIKYSDTIHLFLIDVHRNGKPHWIVIDFEAQKCTVNATYIYFEALNLSSAISRVARWKEGKIKELCNLKKPNKEGINFFKPI